MWCRSAPASACGRRVWMGRLPRPSPAGGNLQCEPEGLCIDERAEQAVTTQDRSVITVRGPVPAASLGVTDAHDHLFLRTPALPGQEFDDLELSTAEVRAARA